MLKKLGETCKEKVVQGGVSYSSDKLPLDNVHLAMRTQMKGQ